MAVANDEPLLLVKDLPATSKRFDAIGYIACCLVVISWVAQSEVSQLVQVSNYNKPLAITWFNHSAGIFVFPLILLTGGSVSECYHKLTKKIGFKQLIIRALILSLIYLFADWIWYIGLPYTSVAAGTAIFNVSSCFVSALSIMVGEPHRPRHTLALILALSGAIAISFRPGTNNASGEALSETSQALGNACVLLAAFSYAVYEVFFDQALKPVGDLDVMATNAFVSLCALLNVCFLWPALFCLDIPGMPSMIAETPEMPSATVVQGLLTNAALATCFNLALAVALVRTSPLLASVSCMLTIPLSLLVDTIVHGDSFGVVELAGSAVVISGFLVIALDR
eukprot:TRINITY_DN21913_c0_g1_i1.p1 TRINITY_DN21913_c0_g1~~TRINITY_DN21913_c0_g1_i1.p1  ORF type:complete len:339 (-),score=30.28 TRINITY_DN21913_c0_g1_i1:41-1057(-)